MAYPNRYSRHLAAVLAALGVLACAACAPSTALAQVAASPAQSPAPSALTFTFDYEMARLVSQAVRDGKFDAQTVAAVRATPAAAAMVRKMHLKDDDALVAYLRTLVGKPQMVAAAGPVADALARADGKYAPLAAIVTRQLADYVPPSLAATLSVHFIFGGNSGGFAFDDDADNVYVNLAMLSQASTQEMAELVAHELFHAVQAHVMTPPPRPAAGAAPAGTGPIWLNRFLYDLEQEATAELFTHRLLERPETAYSGRDLARIARNTRRMKGITVMFESLGLRLLLAPPLDEDDYEGVYGLMFYTDFDALAYDMGWLMANAIEKKDGRPAIVGLLRAPPKRFLLRYQEIAETDSTLPKFSDAFVRAVAALP